MIIEHIDKMTKGWFIGNFVPSVFVTEAFEVGFKIHKAGEKYGFHYHQLVKEINLLVEGEMKMHKKNLKSGETIKYKISFNLVKKWLDGYRASGVEMIKD
jgi:hypothetical protein